MTSRLILVLVFTFGAAAPAFAGDPPAVDDPTIVSYVPTGAQASVSPVPPTNVAPGLGALPVTQALAGVSDWINTDIWPVEMATGLATGRYLEFVLDPADDRVVRVTRVRYASRSYGNSFGILTMATDADGFAAPQGVDTSAGTTVRSVPLTLLPPSGIEFGPGPRVFRLYPYRSTAVLDWLDLVGPDGGLRIDGRVALVRNVGVGQERYSFTTDQLGGAELPAAITHVQFLAAGPAVVLVPFAATAPRTACLPGVAILDLAVGSIDPASITGIAAPCGTIEPLGNISTTLWKLAGGEIFALQVMQATPTIRFRLRRLDDGVFANGFE